MILAASSCVPQIAHVSCTMFSALRRLFAPVAPPALPDYRDALSDLERQLETLARKVSKLEGERLEVLTEWSKTRDQVIRYMKRVAQVKVREEAALGEDQEDGEEELDRQILQLKLNRG